MLDFKRSIEDISSLSDLKKLEKLNIGSNGIKDISAVKSLKELSEFYAYENKIEENNHSWGSMILNICDLSGNSICQWKCLSLRSDGVPDISCSIYGKECTEEEYNKFLERYTKIEMTDCSEFSVVDFMDYIKDGLKNVGVY